MDMSVSGWSGPNLAWQIARAFSSSRYSRDFDFAVLVHRFYRLAAED